MDRFSLPRGGSTWDATRGTFCDLLHATQIPRPSDQMLLNCVQNVTILYLDYFCKRLSPFVEILAAFPSLRSIQVPLRDNPMSVAPYSPSNDTFEPLPKSHSHDKLERIKCETPIEPDKLGYWDKTEGHGFYELTRSLREKKVKIWLATSRRAEPWAELVATPDGPRLSYKTDPCICKTWAPHHMAFRYFFHNSWDLCSPQLGFLQKGFYPLGPGGKPMGRHGRRGTFLVPKNMTSIRDRRLKRRDTMPYIPWDIFILIIRILIKEGFSYLSSDKPLHVRLQCREKPYVFWPGSCGDLLSFKLDTEKERLHDDALAQKKRYRALRIPLSICQETRRLVHRRVLQTHVDIHYPTFITNRFLHVYPGAPEFDENVRFLIFLEVDKLYRGGAADCDPESNFMHAVKYPTPRDRLVLEWIWFVHRREKESSTDKTYSEWDKVEAFWEETKVSR
ncbi:hypothetical protein CKAH01_10935 [Colletotrichum kahawae]|uniref:Uncharacterized protein n=1 Tax=Colletotrichum kahawae TaxID=34407 RepID=A0AAE0CY63_COLKA|nr:hypothetical protein CKAH01_10935 [Colletotrichum kahawae]